MKLTPVMGAETFSHHTPSELDFFSSLPGGANSNGMPMLHRTER
jgi:hypothetical protein